MRSARIELILDTLRAVRGAKDLSKATDDVANSLADTAREGGKAGRAVDDAGDQMSDAARAAGKLDREIDRLTGSLKQMAVAQALTGENFGKQIREQETWLRRLTRNRKLLGDFGDDAGEEAAVGFAARFSQRLGPLITAMPISGPMGAAIVGAAAAAAPLLGAAIAGGIIGGAGIGGVVGGLTLAAKDVRVRAAAEELGGRLEKRLNKAGGAFVGPAIQGLRQVERAVDEIDLEGILSDSARFVQPLVAGVSTAVVEIGGALRELIANAGGPITAISDGIAQIGRSAATGLKSLADNGEDGAAALRTIFTLISSGIQVTFTLVNALTELYGISRAIGGDFALQTMLKLTGAEMNRNAFSAIRTAEGVDVLGGTYIETAKSAKQLAKEQEQLKAAQDRANVTQDALNRTLDSLGGKTSHAAVTSAALTTAMDNLYGATIRQAGANESYEASWDGLSASVKANKRSLDIHTESGRANRDALRSLIVSTNEAYLADINAGVAIDKARQKHDNRIKSIEKESTKLGLNKNATKDLINTYGRIPPKRQTDLILSGIDRVADALLDLAAVQLSLSKGTPLNADLKRRLARAQYGMPDTKRAYGGPLPGHASHDRADNMVYAGTPGEWVIQRPTVRKVDKTYGRGAMAYFNRYGELPAFARGGALAAAGKADWGRSLFFDTNVAKTRIPSMSEAISKVPFTGGGNWPSSPAAQRGDSGVWRSIVALIRSTGPLSGSFGNGYRAGDPKWHGSGRAVDWMGFNQDALAMFLSRRRPLELIHRTRDRDYAYTRGINKGSFNESLMNAHRNHIHIAMDDGGMRMLQPGMNLIPNGTGRPEPIAGPRAMAAIVSGAGGGTIALNVTFAGPVGSQQQLQDWLVQSLQKIKGRGRGF